MDQARADEIIGLAHRLASDALAELQKIVPSTEEGMSVLDRVIDTTKGSRRRDVGLRTESIGHAAFNLIVALTVPDSVVDRDGPETDD